MIIANGVVIFDLTWYWSISCGKICVGHYYRGGRRILVFYINHVLICFYFFRLMKMGALEVDKVVHEHQAWRLFTCIWLHAGVFHILANMLSLLFIGIRLEQEFGFGIHPFSSSNLFLCVCQLYIINYISMNLYLLKMFTTISLINLFLPLSLVHGIGIECSNYNIHLKSDRSRIVIAYQFVLKNKVAEFQG